MFRELHIEKKFAQHFWRKQKEEEEIDISGFKRYPQHPKNTHVTTCSVDYFLTHHGCPSASPLPAFPPPSHSNHNNCIAAKTSQHADEYDEDSTVRWNCRICRDAYSLSVRLR